MSLLATTGLAIWALPAVLVWIFGGASVIDLWEPGDWRLIIVAFLIGIFWPLLAMGLGCWLGALMLWEIAQSGPLVRVRRRWSR